MAPNWKKCQLCGGEFLVVVKGRCAGCSGWSRGPSVDPGASGSGSRVVAQDRKALAAGDDSDEDMVEDTEIF